MEHMNPMQSHIPRSKPDQAGAPVGNGFDPGEDKLKEPLWLDTRQRIDEANVRAANLEAAARQAISEAARIRRRAEAELAQMKRYGISDLAMALLPFKDALESALATQTTDVGAMKAGLELSLRQLQAALEKHGLAEICPCRGEQFDPQRHTPLIKLGADDGSRKVARTEQKGYAIHGRVLRPALVILL